MTATLKIDAHAAVTALARAGRENDPVALAQAMTQTKRVAQSAADAGYSTLPCHTGGHPILLHGEQVSFQPHGWGPEALVNYLAGSPARTPDDFLSAAR